MVAVTRILPRRAGLALVGAAALMLAGMPIGVAADSTSTTSAQVDALWNQPQGARVDSAFYIVQSWWDGVTRGTQRDPRQRGLQELAQANEDLLNAYTLLQEQRNDPGPHPVALVDPMLSGAYGFISGVHVKAPIGSVLGWMNQGLVHLEGRGSLDDILKSLLRDYQKQQAAASRDLAPGPDGVVLTANGPRQSAMLLKIADVASSNADDNALVADVTAPPAQPAPKAAKPDATHGKSDAAHGKPSAHPKGKP
jgi:hypothetical protein